MKKKQEETDISNKAVVIMLILVIVVSLVSLGVYLTVLGDAEDNLSQSSVLTVSENTPSSGAVTLEVLPPPKGGEKLN